MPEAQPSGDVGKKVQFVKHLTDRVNSSHTPSTPQELWSTTWALTRFGTMPSSRWLQEGGSGSGKMVMGKLSALAPQDLVLMLEVSGGWVDGC